MGIYLNPGNDGFRESVNSKIYVDKTGLIEYTNERIGTRQKFLCVSRPRRFGKSMAAEMLVAYYDRCCDSKKLFDKYEISKAVDYEKHLNKYDVIFINIQEFLSDSESIEEMLSMMQVNLIEDLQEKYSDIVKTDETQLIRALRKIYMKTGIGFVFVIDEWDCVFREKRNDKEAQNKYLDFLRNLLKDKTYVGLAYMTGILPIKKYGTHSALNMFEEISMTDARGADRFMGFTEAEVRALCDEHSMDFSETQRWYDGYVLEDVGHVYNPKSVVEAMLYKKFNNYWTQTETYEALKIYIDMDYDGLRAEITDMLGGSRFRVNTTRFTNDMTTFSDKDDVLTLLIHLGYIAYDSVNKEAFIPNEEIRQEFVNAMTDPKWSAVIDAVKRSDALLEALLNGDAEAVAAGVDKVHEESTSVLTYNNENSLSCVVNLAFYSARESYKLVRELPAGKGFADIAFIPLKNVDKPAIVIELKWDESADGAINQIKERNYCASLADYSGKVILAGISYDKSSKKHECKIETLVK